MKHNPKNPFPSVIAVVLTHNEAEDTIRCVQSLLGTEYPSLQIIIVDNASVDGTPEKIKKVFPNIRMIIREVNGGYPAGNNTGIRTALEQKADYILISNSDIIVEKGFLQPMLDIVEGEPDVGVVACTVRYQANPEEIYYAAGTYKKLFCSAFNVTPEAKQLIERQQNADVTFVNGALLLFRRQVFEDLGLIEEKFFLYHDDLEFSRRYGSKYRLVYTPKATVYHKSGAGKGWRNYTLNYLYYHTRNRFWVFEDESLWYRVYVGLFTFTITLMKTIFISLNFFSDSNVAKKQIGALWRGFRDGMKGRK